MKSSSVLLLILTSLILVLIGTAIAPEVASATGVNHPKFNGMKISVANVDQQNATRWLAYLYGFGIISLFTVMHWIGNKRQGKITPFGKWILISGGLYLFVFTMMEISNWNYVSSEENQFFGFLPKPTAWMIWGMWFTPVILTVMYTLNFDNWVISNEELEELKAIIEAEKNVTK